MKHLRETFTDKEFEDLKIRKANLEINWHDFIMTLLAPPIMLSFPDCSQKKVSEISEMVMNKIDEMKISISRL